MLSATTLKVRPIGTTVDFCPVCRCKRGFELAEARQHRYALVFDRGPVAQPHHELTCQTCGAILERDVNERPVTMRSRPVKGSRAGGQPEVLPLVLQRIHDWEDLEQRRKAGRLRPDERQEMIRTAMLSFSRLYDEQPMERVHPAVVGLLALGLAGIGVGGYFAWRATESTWAIGGAAVAGVVVVLCAVAWVRARCPKTRVRRWVASALAPLDPTEAEILAIKREMLTHRLKSGECIRPARMRKAIDRQRVRMGLVRPA